MKGLSLIRGKTGKKFFSEQILWEKASEFIRRKCWVEAIGCLVELNRQNPNAKVQQTLVDLRFRAFKMGEWPEPSSSLRLDQQIVSDCPNQPAGVREIEPDSLSAQELANGICGEGALIVRDFISRKKAEQLRALIAKVLEYQAGAQPDLKNASYGWLYRSPEISGAPARFFSGGGHVKSESASLWAVDSPYLASELIELYRQLKLPEILKELFGEPAMLTARKWVLRKVAPSSGGGAGWHQDGRFLGDGIRTINMWIALNDCGGDQNAPGMELIPHADRKIYPTGTHGADFDWTVGPGLIDEIRLQSSIANPRFRAGDALFFDHYNLHRTGFSSHQTQPRYAIESWFFAASSAPQKQYPLFFVS